MLLLASRSDDDGRQLTTLRQSSALRARTSLRVETPPDRRRASHHITSHDKQDPVCKDWLLVWTKNSVLKSIRTGPLVLSTVFLWWPSKHPAFALIGVDNTYYQYRSQQENHFWPGTGRHLTSLRHGISALFPPRANLIMLQLNRRAPLPRTQDLHQRPAIKSRHHCPDPRYGSSRESTLSLGPSSTAYKGHQHRVKLQCLSFYCTHHTATSDCLWWSPTTQEQSRGGSLGWRSVQQDASARNITSKRRDQRRGSAARS